MFHVGLASPRLSRFNVLISFWNLSFAGSCYHSDSFLVTEGNSFNFTCGSWSLSFYGFCFIFFFFLGKSWIFKIWKFEVFELKIWNFWIEILELEIQILVKMENWNWGEIQKFCFLESLLLKLNQYYKSNSILPI